jgi:hypothetical protein
MVFSPESSSVALKKAAERIKMSVSCMIWLLKPDQTGSNGVRVRHGGADLCS